MKDISIIIPVYNVEQYVKECIDSVIAQKDIEDINVECIIVDDRGNDCSMDIVRSIVSAYVGPIEFNIVTREKNGGLSAARNSGIRIAKGEYVYFLDSDDTISQSCISTLWDEVIRRNRPNIVLGKTACFPKKIMRNYFDFKLRGIPEYVSNKDNVEKYYLTLPEIACNRLIDLKWMKSNDLFFKEGILHEDFHWHLKSYQYIKSFSYLPIESPTYNYRMREDSIIAKSKGFKRLKTMAEICLDIASSNKLWNNYILRVFVEQIFVMLKYNYSPEEKIECVSLLDKLYSQITKNYNFRTKILIAYFKLPNIFIRKRIVNLIIG